MTRDQAISTVKLAMYGKESPTLQPDQQAFVEKVVDALRDRRLTPDDPEYMREEAKKALSQENQEQDWFGWKSWALELADYVMTLTDPRGER